MLTAEADRLRDAVASRRLDEFDRVGHFLLDRAHSIDRVLELFLLAADRLRLLGIVPQCRVLQLQQV